MASSFYYYQQLIFVSVELNMHQINWPIVPKGAGSIKKVQQVVLTKVCD